jgi:hypothetical protein
MGEDDAGQKPRGQKAFLENSKSGKGPYVMSTITTKDDTKIRYKDSGNISHLGRSGLDELVPSRYALRVGEIDVLVVSDGPPTPTRPSCRLGCATGSCRSGSNGR